MSIKRNLDVWAHLIKMQLYHDLAYPSQFICNIISSVLFTMAGPILGIVLYTNTLGFPGWSFHQFILLYGSFALWVGISSTVFIAAIWRIVRAIQRGDFDKYMIRPIKPHVFVLMHGWDYDGLGRVGMGLILIFYAALKLDLMVNITGLLTYLWVMVLGIMFTIGEIWLVLGLAFKFIKTDAVMHVFGVLFEFSKYPLTIYRGPVKFFLTFVFPVGLVAFYPASALLGFLSAKDLAIATLVSFGFFFMGYIAFWWGMRRHTSAGG
ncbi:MAG TPA: hypothetical protein ENN30_01050 [Candidatus Woesearchaeota archaeon]|nr:hypothetical protein [Candidatus Woesearchaeota archaeon]